LRRKAKKNRFINYAVVVVVAVAVPERLRFGWRIVQVKSAIAAGVN